MYRHCSNTATFPFSLICSPIDLGTVILLFLEGCKTVYYEVTAIKQETWVALVRMEYSL